MLAAILKASPMIAILITSALICLSLPAAVLAALQNNRDARPAKSGNQLR
jgi:hypothetical protein